MTERFPGGRPLQLEWSDRSGDACLRVTGWTAPELQALAALNPAEIGQRLAVLPTALVSAARPSALQPSAGRFEVGPDAVRFFPRFPFVPGTAYSLLVTSAESGYESAEQWSIERPPRPARPTTAVATFYPTADTVPLNLLKLYIYFTAPMSEGWALRSIHVRRADNGEPLENVFLQAEPELWDQDRQRLTMLLDPGRIKRGLAPHEEVGYPLIESVPIVVSVDPTFRDAAGQPLAVGWEQRYEVGPALRARIDPSTWRREAPKAGSKGGLTVSFGRPLDHALLEHSLRVLDSRGTSVLGYAYGGPGEWCWWFEPEGPWEPGLYALEVDPRLEDLSGNSVIRVFDRDLTLAADAPGDARPALVPFEVE